MMKAQNQLNRKAIKLIAKCYRMTNEGLKSASVGLDLSKFKDEAIPDGYLHIQSECVDEVNDSSIFRLAKSLSIKRVEKAAPEHLRALLDLSKAETDNNNIFYVARSEKGITQVIIFWKHC